MRYLLVFLLIVSTVTLALKPGDSVSDFSLPATDGKPYQLSRKSEGIKPAIQTRLIWRQLILVGPVRCRVLSTSRSTFVLHHSKI